MTDKKKGQPKASPENSHIDNTINTSGSAQRRRLLEWMRSTSIDTICARRDLNILMPAARIKELKNMGYVIHTQRIKITDDLGRSHNGIALYSLISEPHSKVAA